MRFRAAPSLLTHTPPRRRERSDPTALKILAGGIPVHGRPKLPRDRAIPLAIKLPGPRAPTGIEIALSSKGDSRACSSQTRRYPVETEWDAPATLRNVISRAKCNNSMGRREQEGVRSARTFFPSSLDVEFRESMGTSGHTAWYKFWAQHE